MKNNVYEQSTKPMLRYLAISFVLFISFIFSVSNLSAQGGTWEEITYDNFESGWGNFVDGGSDASRYLGFLSHQGDYSIKLRDDSGILSSTYCFSMNFSDSNYSQLKIEFWCYFAYYWGAGNLYVEYWNGNNWQLFSNLDIDFTPELENFDYYFYSDIIDTQNINTSDFKIRIRNDAPTNWSAVYIDEILISGLLPPAPVNGITLSPQTDDIVIAGSSFLHATVSPTDAGDQTVSWASANETIATVDATGLVTGVAEGTTTVTATTNDGGFTDQAVVHVFSHGDVNKDRYVGAFDAGIVLQHSVGNPTDDWGVSTPWTSFETSAADVDMDETVTATDASYILQYVAGMISSLPVPAKKSAEKPQISYEIQENAFVLYAGQEVFGLNLSVKAEGTTIQLPEILVQDVLSATNQKEESYLIGLAAANPVPAGTPLVRIPFKQEQGVVVFDINMNGLSAILSHAFSSTTAIEKGDTPGFSCEVSPNPVQSSCRIRLFNPVPAESCVRIYSMDGRLVKQLYKGTPVGYLHPEWDRTNMNNHAAPAGMYIYAVINGKSRLTGKLICR